MTEKDNSIYAAALGDVSEIQRGIEITFLGVEIHDFQEGTFSGPPELKAWSNWIEIWFEPVILPAFREIYEAAAAMKHREIADLDRGLSQLFTAEMTGHSTDAAQAFRGSKAEVRHMDPWVRFEKKLEAGETPGHLPTLFALQSALFNVPINSALISYGLAEWLGAKPNAKSDTEPALNRLRASIAQTPSIGLRAI